jgi:hypothetical protein
LDVNLKEKQQHMNDHWSFRLVAKAKTISISNNELKRTLWEKWLFGAEAPLPGVPEHTKIDPTMIFDAANCREWLATKTEQCTSIASLKKIVKDNLGELIKMDEHFGVMEWIFLTEHFDSLMEERMRSLMLEVLPNIGEKRNIAKAAHAARLLSAGETALAQAKNIQGDMVSAANALQDISMSVTPSGKELSQMSTWMVLFHKRAENFAFVVADSEEQFQAFASSSSTPRRGGTRCLYGSDSLKFRYSRCRKNESGAPDEEDLKQLKQFRWCLNEAENKQVNEWLASKVLTTRDKIMNRQKALIDVERSIAAKRNGEGSEDQVVAAPPLKKVLQVENAKSVDMNDDDEVEDVHATSSEQVHSTGVLSFFGAKAM